MKHWPKLAASLVTCALLAATGLAHAQASLPPTPPTTMAPLAATPTVTHGRHAYVTFHAGLLEVRADNSSLNVILRDVARVTGMVIRGGVADQRVFGNYGPAAPSAVLATLLDGTGVNVVLQETADGAPSQLNLSPRTGTVSAPGPDSAQYDEEARAEALPAPITPTPASAPPASTANVSAPSTAAPTPVSAPSWINANTAAGTPSPTASSLPAVKSVPSSSLPGITTVSEPRGIADNPNPPSTAAPATHAPTPTPTAPPASPNGVKTPEQIAQELMQMEKAKKPAAPGTTP